MAPLFIKCPVDTSRQDSLTQTEKKGNLCT